MSVSSCLFSLAAAAMAVLKSGFFGCLFSLAAAAMAVPKSGLFSTLYLYYNLLSTVFYTMTISAVYSMPSFAFRYCPVKLTGFSATSSGVPSAITVPPPSPPSGPRSII